MSDKIPTPPIAMERFSLGKINSGFLLIGCAILAMLCANIPGLSDLYFSLWNQPIVVKVGSLELLTVHGEPMTLLQFVNDALMTIFFFSVGLEIKRETLVGELSDLKHAILPIIAAIGGMVIPVAFFYLQTNDPVLRQGMVIPMATDIAFSLGVLSLLGSRVPISIKVFLTTLAVADDIGGIVVIAALFSGHINLSYILFSLLTLAAIYIGAYQFKIAMKSFYLVLGVVFWMLFTETGIHPTIAGVLMAFAIPARPRQKVGKYIETIRAYIDVFPRRKIEENKKIILSREQMDILKAVESASDRVISPLQDMEDSMSNLVNYFIMPLFAFANAGIIFSGNGTESLFGGVTIILAISLCIGKFIGIFSFSWLAIKLKIATLPEESNWKQIAGISIFGGIGFTVALFIAELSYGSQHAAILNQAKLGIVCGSVIAGIIGYIFLNKVLPKK